MTDLEDLWESYPTSEPPTHELLREGRRRARLRSRRLVLRPLLAAVTTAALGGAFLLGTSVGPHTGGTIAAPQLRSSAFRADLHAAASCADLLSSYRTRGRAAVTAYGWGGAWGWPRVESYLGTLARGDAARTVLPAAASTRLDAERSSRTGTNVQETDVDEPDVVKTDGSRIVRVDGGTLSVYDASGDSIRRTARLALPRLRDAEILLAGDTVVAIGTDAGPSASRRAFTPGSRVQTVSLADPSDPTIVSDVAYSGAIASVRQHGTVVRVVVASAPPALDFVHPHGKLTERAALARNRELVRSTNLADWLPTYDDGDGALPLLDCDDVAIPPAGLALGTVSVVGFDAAAPDDRDTIGVAGQTGIAYESADHLYLVDSPGWGGWGGCWCIPARTVTDAAGRRSAIFQLDLDGIRAVHVATGHVEGTIADRWSVDEADDVLRVAVTRDETPSPTPATSPADQIRRVLPRSSSVVTMRAEGDHLVESGRLDGLGVDETLTAARWTDDLAILSTARATDPLYTVDLSDPDRPRLLGALKIPGFTSYLHPIGDGRLLAIGEAGAFTGGGGRAGAQVGLFDISDLTDVRQIDVSSLRRWTWPVAGDDPRAFTWLGDRDTALTTFTTNRGSIVLGVYRVAGSTLSAELRDLPVRDVSRVRTFELADGRVVLMAGSSLELLDL